MNTRRQVFEIARWEFLRFFKLRDLVLSIVLVGGVTAAIQGISYWQERSRPVIELAVISPLDLALPADRFAIESHRPGGEVELRRRVADQDLDGLLLVRDGEATLVARKEPVWLGEVNAAVSAAWQDARLDALGVDRARLAAALAPVAVAVELAGPRQGSEGKKTLAAVLTGLVLVSLVMGISFLFMSITGEKQQRVSEQIFSITSAQALIDGKLAGIGAVALLSTIQLGAIGLAVYQLVDGGAVSWAIDLARDVGPADAAVLLAFAASGFAFWFVVCGAIFATIDDPHSSARNNVLTLPMLAPAAVFLGLGNPDSVMMHALSWLPPTSMTVMPARVILSEVAWWEIAGSLAVSLAAIAFFRRAAGRLYEAAMLMYGKEPGLSQMIRWVRAGRDRRAAG